MGAMAVMTAKDGDLKVGWDPAQEQEVEQARETFDKWSEKGYAAYSVHEGGKTGEVMREFDPGAESIVMRPQMVGG